MGDLQKIMILLNESNLTQKELVSLFILLDSLMNINTISGMAKQEGKTYRGILESSRYQKIDFNGKKLAIKLWSAKTVR